MRRVRQSFFYKIYQIKKWTEKRQSPTLYVERMPLGSVLAVARTGEPVRTNVNINGGRRLGKTVKIKIDDIKMKLL